MNPSQGFSQWWLHAALTSVLVASLPMTAKALLPLLLPLLAWLCPALATAAEEAKKEPPSLAEVAATKAGAMLCIYEKQPNPEPGMEYGHSLGVFISTDGLALLNLSSLAMPNMPEFLTMDGKMPPLGTILGILPEPGLALVKFKHKPKEWLPLARKEPEVGESIAIAGLSDFLKLKEKVPPIIGPVLAKRGTIGGNLLKVDYRRVMSLGAGMSGNQRKCFVQGSYAVNRQDRSRPSTLSCEDSVRELVSHWKGLPLTGSIAIEKRIIVRN